MKLSTLFVLISMVPIIIGAPSYFIPIPMPWGLLEALGIGQTVKGFNGTWISDAEILYQTESGDYNILNMITNKNTTIATSEELTEWRDGKFALFPDKKKFLIRYDAKALFRHSIVARYDIYDLETKQVTHIADKKRLQYCIYAPTSNRLAYVLDNNVYIRQPDNNEIKLTNDGEINEIYNGIPDWVYEEEVLSTGSAIWWSPDGDKLIIGHFNDMNVKNFKYFLYGETSTDDDNDNNEQFYQYPKEINLKYPKPGTPNPIVQLKLINVKNLNGNAKANWQIIQSPNQIIGIDHIMSAVTWTNNENFIITWENRRQNLAILMKCNLKGSCTELKQFSEPYGWIMASNLICNQNGLSCMLINWIGNWLQAWNIDTKTGQNLWHSLGNFTVLKIYGFMEDRLELYHQSTLSTDVTQHHVFQNNKCISCTIQDINGVNCTQASASFSKELSYYAVTCTGPTPSYTKLFETKGNREILNWEKNEYFREIIETKLMPTIKYLEVPVTEKIMATVKLYLPPNLDWSIAENNTNIPIKKYPLIVDVYGGPNSARINNGLKIGWMAYLVTQRNIIYAEIESRGSGNKGKEILMSINNHLGEYEVIDQITVTKNLQNNYKIFDRERTGIWGWSYGGYVTAMAMALDDQRIFQCGASVAPVTSWIYYDSIYTERYMGLPTKDDNLDNYLKSDVTRNIKNFKNHDFLLIHGIGDDNVHVQNSMLLSKELQRADILFEEMLYPDENHSIGSFLNHLYHTMDQFWINCLNLEIDEE